MQSEFGGTGEGGLSVMVVDDSPVMRSFIRRVLELAGLQVREVIEAGDGRSALEYLGGARVDLILSDINMPRMNGSELVQALRADPRLAAIPVIIISTDSSRQRMESMRKIGASGYLAKPFQPELLRAEIERVLGL